MSLATPDVDSLTELFESLAPPCEHSGHGKDDTTHGGAAEWIMYYPAGSSCECPPLATPRCDKWKRYVMESNPQPRLCCRHGRIMTEEEMAMIYVEPINQPKS